MQTEDPYVLKKTLFGAKVATPDRLALNFSLGGKSDSKALPTF
jgi:hypothetical protein